MFAFGWLFPAVSANASVMKKEAHMNKWIIIADTGIFLKKSEHVMTELLLFMIINRTFRFILLFAQLPAVSDPRYGIFGSR